MPAAPGIRRRRERLLSDIVARLPIADAVTLADVVEAKGTTVSEYVAELLHLGRTWSAGPKGCVTTRLGFDVGQELAATCGRPAPQPQPRNRGRGPVLPGLGPVWVPVVRWYAVQPTTLSARGARRAERDY